LARISWDGAIDLIAERFTAIIAEYGPETLLPHRYLGSMGTFTNMSGKVTNWYPSGSATNGISKAGEAKQQHSPG
jgi:anaerobic selenocysteine-containing dehydrogenase